MFYLLLDILIYNFTPYLSYFSLLNINNKSYICNISIALLLDTLITHTLPLNMIWFTILFFSKKYLFKFNYHNFLTYIIFNVSIILLYYVINNILFSFLTLNNIINVLIINNIMIAISYKFNNVIIK